jgi:hypothetical protein
MNQQSHRKSHPLQHRSRPLGKKIGTILFLSQNCLNRKNIVRVCNLNISSAVAVEMKKTL